jgi:hypothetical protein
MTRDVSKVSGHQDEDPPAVCEIKNVQKLKCMKYPHRFIAQFFAKDNWIMVYKKAKEEGWFDGFELTVTKRGKEQILMLAEHMYTLYTRFQKKDYPRTKPVSTADFFAELKRIGLEPKKMKFRGSRPNQVIRIEKEKVMKKITEVYNITPESFGNWSTGKQFAYLARCVKDSAESELLPRLTQEFESGDDESESDSDVDEFGECERVKNEDEEDGVEEDEMCCD